MKHFKFIFLLAVAFIIYSYNALALDPVHFIPSVSSGDNMTLIIPVANVPKIGLDNIAVGDEIGVFTPGGVCAGSGVWDGEADLAIPLFADDEYTDPVDGFVVNDAISFKIWSSADNTEYPNVTVTWGSRTLPTFQATFDGKWRNNQLANINALVAAATPKQVTITNPLNNSINIATSGNITWNTLANANSYDVQLSTTNTYTTKIIDANVTTGTRAYSGLSNGTTYYVRVRGINAEGAGNWREHIFKTQLATPTLTSPANNSVNQAIAGTASWSTVTGADLYHLQIATDAAFTSLVVNQASLATNSYAFSGLNYNTTYYWRVKAKANGGDESSFSNTFMFKTTVNAPTLNTPANNTFCVALNGNLTWNSVAGATAYEVQIATDNAFANVFTQNLNNTTTIFAYTGLNNNTVYYWRVKAKNADGAGSYSSVYSFTTVLAAPSLTSPANNAMSIALNGTLTWGTVAGATAYEVLVATDAAFTNVILTDLNVATTTKALASLTNNTSYYWKVRAKNANCTGDYSNTFNFETVLAAPLLSSPLNAINIPVDGNLNWQGVAGAATYDVQLSLNGTFTNFVINQTGVVGTSLAYANLLGKTSYYWRARAVKTGSTSDWSAIGQFTTHLAPVVLSAPVNNAKGQNIASSIQWNTLNGADTYGYQIATDNAFTNIVHQGTTPSLTAAYTGFNYNTVYYWRVRGIDGFGNGPWSTIFNFETFVPAPVLATPTNNSIDVPLLGNLTWNAASGATSYDVQVSELNTFTSLKINKTGVTTTSTSYSGLAPNTMQYWRVRGVKSGVAGPWSNVFAFTTVQIEPPTLVSPLNNATGTLLDVTLDWNPVLNGTSYNVELSTNIGFTNVIAVGTEVPETEFDVFGLNYGTTYYWRAQSNGDLGSSNWSESFKFTTIPAPSYSGVTTVCEGTVETYTAPYSDIIDYNWEVVGGTIQGPSTSNIVIVKWNNAGYGTLKLNRSSAEWGEFTDFIEKEIGINPQMAISINLNVQKYNSDKGCLNENITFTATTGSVVTNWVWNLGDGTFKTGRVVTHKYMEPGNYNVYVYAVGPNCRVGEQNTMLVVTDDCDITVVFQEPDTTCKNSPYTLSPSVFGGTGEYTYSWSPASDFVDATVLDGTVSNPVSSKSYTLTATDANSGETGSKANTLVVLNNPTVTLKSSSLQVKNNNPINLNSYRNNATGGTAPYTYVWTLNENTVADPENEYPAGGTSIYYLTVYDDKGCVSTPKRFIVYKSARKEMGDDVIAGVNGGSLLIAYPNPVSNVLNIFAEFAQESNVNIRVVDIIGQEVMFVNKGEVLSLETTLDMTSLTSGIYMLIIESNGDSIMKKIIKE